MTSTASLPSPRAGDPWSPQPRSGNGRVGPPTRQRRRWAVGLALVLVALGAVANTLLWVAADQRVPVLAVARPVPWGQQITEADVVVVRLSTDSGVSVVAERDRGRVVGHWAASNLEPGMLLTTDLVKDQGLPAAGQHLVAVPLRPGGVPARGLRPGDAVLVVVGGDAVPTGAGTAGAGAAGLAGLAPVAGRVAQLGPPAADGSVTVDVAVAEAVGPRLAAALASAGGQRQAAVVLLPAGR